MKSGIDAKVGLETQKVLDGTLIIKELANTNNTIGKMNKVCNKCSAIKFPKESDHLCCSNGKISNLQPFHEPPEEIRHLWKDMTHQGKLFRKYIRPLNNSLSMASLVVRERIQPGFSPTVTFMGKATHRLGPLQPAEGQRPRFVQLYVLGRQHF